MYRYPAYLQDTAVKDPNEFTVEVEETDMLEAS